MISYYLLNLDVCPLQNCRFWDICNSSEKKESETFFSVKLLPSPFFLNVQLLLLLSLSLSLSLSFLLELKLIKPQTNKQTNTVICPQKPLPDSCLLDVDAGEFYFTKTSFTTKKILSIFDFFL